MAVPDYQSMMLPLLRVVADENDHSIRDLTTQLAEVFLLSEDEVAELLPSGRQTTLYNRVQWAKTYMKKAGLVDTPGRGLVRITPAGKIARTHPIDKIDNAFLLQYPSFREFRDRNAAATPVVTTGEGKTEATPEEVLESTWKALRRQCADEMLEKIRQCSPAFFERIVVDLLLAMGYGGSRAEAGRSIGRTGDGGIDGIINEDKLGLDVVYVQAKRWDGNVGRPVVQAFAGSLEGVRARKGVMITTSGFTADAKQYVSHIEKRIVLIDGEMLAELMLEHGVGVSAARNFPLLKVDLDYFEEE